MEACWRRLESWIQTNAPHLLQFINVGATQFDISKLEDIIMKPLPKDFVQFYKIHNGQNEEKGMGREGLIDSELLLPIVGIIREWKCGKELLDKKKFVFDGQILTSVPDNGIKNDWWNSSWIPFTHDGCGNYICIDLDPAPGGNLGQVIRMWHDSQYRELYANSFSEYISNFIDGLENGKFVYVKGWGLVNKDSPFNKP